MSGFGQRGEAKSRVQNSYRLLTKQLPPNSRVRWNSFCSGCAPVECEQNSFDQYAFGMNLVSCMFLLGVPVLPVARQVSIGFVEPFDVF